jgi:hypothetical protein
MTAPSANATPPIIASGALRQDVASRLCASSSEQNAEFTKRGQRLLRTAIVASMQHALGRRLRDNTGYRLWSNCNHPEPVRYKPGYLSARVNIKPCRHLSGDIGGPVARATIATLS